MSDTSGDRLPPPAGDPGRADGSPCRRRRRGSLAGPSWVSLPEPVRSRLAEAASVAVGAMPCDDVPVPLRRLARFTPAKRSRLGRAALLAELEGSGAFRAAVVAWWEEHRPGELTPSAADPLAAAAAAVLVADPGAADAVALAARRGEAVELRAERDEALARVDKLTERARAAARRAGRRPGRRPVRGAGARRRVPAAAQAGE